MNPETIIADRRCSELLHALGVEVKTRFRWCNGGFDYEWHAHEVVEECTFVDPSYFPAHTALELWDMLPRLIGIGPDHYDLNGSKIKPGSYSLSCEKEIREHDKEKFQYHMKYSCEKFNLWSEGGRSMENIMAEGVAWAIQNEHLKPGDLK